MKQILEMVARYVTDEKLLASWYLWRDAFKLMSGRFKSAELFARLVNAGGDLVCTRYNMPLAEALSAGSGGAPKFLLFCFPPVCGFTMKIWKSTAMKVLGC